MFQTTIIAISNTLVAFLLVTATLNGQMDGPQWVGVALSSFIALIALYFWASTVVKVVLLWRECNASKPDWDELGDLLARYMDGDKPDQQTFERIKAYRAKDEVLSKT
jgi:hypothetical protein